MKSFLQTFMFLAIALVQRCLPKKQDNAEVDAANNKTNRGSLALWAIVYSLAIGTMTMTAYVGVKMIPIPDFVVFGHTSSVFTFFFSACFLRYFSMISLHETCHITNGITFRERMTLLKSMLVATVISGVVLVVQPVFLFGTVVNMAGNNSDVFNASFKEDIYYKSSGLPPVGTPTYYAGVAIAFLCASSAGLTNVASAKARGLSRNILMVTGGLGTLLVAVISQYSLGQYFALPSSSLTDWERALATSGVSVASIVAGLLCIVANQVKVSKELALL